MVNKQDVKAAFLKEAEHNVLWNLYDILNTIDSVKEDDGEKELVARTYITYEQLSLFPQKEIEHIVRNELSREVGNAIMDKIGFTKRDNPVLRSKEYEARVKILL